MNITYQNTIFTVKKKSYTNKRLALILEEQFNEAMPADEFAGLDTIYVSVNLPAAHCKADEIYVDTNKLPNDLIDLLTEQNIISDIIGSSISGFVIYPRVKVLIK